MQYVFLLLKRFLSVFDYSESSYAQEGEDLVLERFLNNLGKKGAGCYVDVGAHHPKRFSNTYRLYTRGWSGICIDPIAESRSFASFRPRDKFLNIGVAEAEGLLEYFMFNEQALNTFDQRLAKSREENTEYRVVGKKTVATKPLRLIFEDYLQGRTIDVMSVDVEGYDLEVLRSNDWERFRPTIVLAEELDGSSTSIKDFMNTMNYSLAAKTYNTLFFLNGDVCRSSSIVTKE